MEILELHWMHTSKQSNTVIELTNTQTVRHQHSDNYNYTGNQGT